jgi:hypothetical protein
MFPAVSSFVPSLTAWSLRKKHQETFSGKIINGSDYAGLAISLPWPYWIVAIVNGK